MEYKPDVLLMDLSMPPGESGLIATSKIADSFPETKILILTMFDDEEYLFHVLRNGAKGYILKNAPDEQLLLAIRTVYKGETYVDMKLTTSLVNEFVSNSNQDTANTSDPFKILSKRELEILPLIAKGYGNKEIAEKLFVSVKTVEAHKTHIMTKLGLKSKPELVEYALKKIIRVLEFEINTIQSARGNGESSGAFVCFEIYFYNRMKANTFSFWKAILILLETE